MTGVGQYLASTVRHTCLVYVVIYRAALAHKHTIEHQTLKDHLVLPSQTSSVVFVVPDRLVLALCASVAARERHPTSQS
jgi:hypothetical protein